MPTLWPTALPTYEPTALPTYGPTLLPRELQRRHRLALPGSRRQHLLRYQLMGLHCSPRGSNLARPQRYQLMGLRCSFADPYTRAIAGAH